MYPAVYLLRDPRRKSRPIFYVGAVPQAMQAGLGRARPVDLATGNLIPDVEWDARSRVEVILESGLSPICEVIYYKVPPRNVGLAVDALIATMTAKPLNRSCDAVLDVDGAVARMAHLAPVTLPEGCWALAHVLPAQVAGRDVLAAPDEMLRTIRDFKVGSEPVGPNIRRAIDALRRTWLDALFDIGSAQPVTQRHLVDPEILRDLSQGHTRLTGSGDPNHVVAELLGVRLGHSNILPARPTGQANSDVSYPCSSPHGACREVYAVREVGTSHRAVAEHDPDVQRGRVDLNDGTRDERSDRTEHFRWLVRFRPACGGKPKGAARTVHRGKQPVHCCS